LRRIPFFGIRTPTLFRPSRGRRAAIVAVSAAAVAEENFHLIVF
jgi:hypothetical protein